MLIVLGLLLGFVAVLAVPIHVAFRLEGVEAFNAQLGIRCLFGLVRLRIDLPHVSEIVGSAAAKPKLGKRRAPGRARVRPGGVVAVLRQPAFRERVRRFTGDLLRAAHINGLQFRLRLGLGDPADTGLLWAVVGPLNAVARDLLDADLRIEPEFLDPVFEFRAHGRAVVVPVQLLALAIGFALSPASVRAWLTVRRGQA